MAYVGCEGGAEKVSSPSSEVLGDVLNIVWMAGRLAPLLNVRQRFVCVA